MPVDIQNILLIIIDSWRGHALGAAGDPCIKTPNLDALVRDGVLFCRHYCQAVPCGPSRASLMTGQYMMNHRVVLNGTPMAAEHSNLAFELRKAGYDPSLIGFTTSVPDPRVAHWNDPRFRTDTVMDGWTVVRSFKTLWDTDMASEYLRYLNSLGYDVRLGFEDLFDLGADDDEMRTGLSLCRPSPIAAKHSDTAWCAEAALDLLSYHRREQWMLHLGFFRPHPPFIAPAPYHEMYDPEVLPAPLRCGHPDAQAQSHPFLKYFLDTTEAKFAAGHLPGRAADLSESEIRQLKAQYYGLCTEVDDHLGRVFDLLKETGQYDRTLIMVTSDHGEQLGDHYSILKRSFYEPSFHIPLIVRDPRPEADVTRGRKVTRFTENVDVMPTILDWLGQKIPRQCDGRSLLLFCHGEEPDDWRTEAFYEFDFRDLETMGPHKALGLGIDECSLAALRDDRFTYVHFAALPPLLFDMQSDPDQFTNVAVDANYREVLLEYAQRMLSWRLRHADRTLTGVRGSPNGLVGSL